MIFILGMGSYHIIPSEFLIGRLIYYICLYGAITGFLFYLRHNSKERKYRKFYLIASFYSIVKMMYHLWIGIMRHKYARYGIEYDKALIDYQKGLIEYQEVLSKYNLAIIEYKFTIFGIEFEMFAAIFSVIVFIILLSFKFNNDG